MYNDGQFGIDLAGIEAPAASALRYQHRHHSLVSLLVSAKQALLCTVSCGSGRGYWPKHSCVLPLICNSCSQRTRNWPVQHCSPLTSLPYTCTQDNVLNLVNKLLWLLLEVSYHKYAYLHLSAVLLYPPGRHRYLVLQSVYKRDECKTWHWMCSVPTTACNIGFPWHCLRRLLTSWWNLCN